MNISPYIVVSVIALVLYGGSRILTYENNRPTEVSAPAAAVAPLDAVSYVANLTAPAAATPAATPQARNLVCALKNDVQNVKDIPCELYEDRSSNGTVTITFAVHGTMFNFYGRYAEGGIEITSSQYNDFPVEQVFGFCEVGDGEAGCEITNGTSVMKMSAYYDN